MQFKIINFLNVEVPFGIKGVIGGIHSSHSHL